MYKSAQPTAQGNPPDRQAAQGIPIRERCLTAPPGSLIITACPGAAVPLPLVRDADVNPSDVSLKPEPPEVLDAFYKLFRDYFDVAERRRRWSIADDVPWDQCNRSLNPAVAEVVVTFCAVELYLPDY